MHDLIYGGNEYIDDIKEIFPTAKIEDASDEIHEDRISIEVDLERKEYFRLIILNGFGQMSLGAHLLIKDEVAEWIAEWKIDYPQYFKGEEEK